MRSDVGRGLLALFAVLLSGACAHVDRDAQDGQAAISTAAASMEGPDGVAADETATPPPTPMGTSASAPVNPYADDVTTIRFRDRAPADALVHSASGVYITVAEFNAWLGTYPLHITSDTLAGAQGEALAQMVRFKLLADSARSAGYVEKLGPGTDTKTLALAYLRDQLGNVGMISDDAVARYEREHPERLAQLGSDVPAQIRAMAIKGAIRGEQIRVQIEDLEKQTGIRYTHAPPR